MAALMWRSPTGLGLGTHHKSESETTLTDSGTRGSSHKVDTALHPEITPHTIVSPLPKSLAREIAQEILTPNIEAKGDVDPPKVSTNLALDKNNTNGSREYINGPLVDENDTRVPPLALKKRFHREEIVNEILDLTNQDASVALFGSIGVGKTFVARTVLDHSQTKARFGENRHFMRCDDLTNTQEAFLERLSEAIRIERTTDEGKLRSHLESSPPLIVLLDGVDFIIDKLTPESEAITATIEEFGSYQHVCLVTTSWMNPEIRGFHRVEAPIPSEDDARDIFYSLCKLGKSPALDSLIIRLDFHPLSIEHIASCVRENNWDEPTLLKAWNDDHTSALKTSYYERLRDTIEPVFRSRTFTTLGPIARDVLEAIAAFPSGIRESDLEGIFHKTAGIGDVVDVLCKPSLVCRDDGFVKMISPFQFYFLESMIVPARTNEVINVRWGPNCMPAPACMSFSLHPFYCCDVTFILKGFPYTPKVPLLVGELIIWVNQCVCLCSVNSTVIV